MVLIKSSGQDRGSKRWGTARHTPGGDPLSHELAFDSYDDASLHLSGFIEVLSSLRKRIDITAFYNSIDISESE